MGDHYFRQVKVRFSDDYFKRNHESISLNNPAKIFDFASDLYDGRNNIYAFMSYDAKLQPLDVIYFRGEHLRYYLDNPKDIIRILLLQNATSYSLVHYLSLNDFDKYQLTDSLYTNNLVDLLKNFDFKYLDTIQVDPLKTYCSFQESKALMSNNSGEYISEKNIEYKCPQNLTFQSNLKAVMLDGVEYIGDNKTIEDAINIIGKEMSDYNYEEVCIINLNKTGVPKSYAVISSGGLDRSIVDIRVLYQQAILTNTDKIVMLHNHPSGSTEPSDQDVVLTKRLIDVGKLVGVELIDSVIVGAGYELSDFYSMREVFTDYFNTDYKVEYKRSHNYETVRSEEMTI